MAKKSTNKTSENFQTLTDQEILHAYFSLNDPKSLDQLAIALKTSRLSLTPHLSDISEIWGLLKTYIDRYVEENFDAEDSNNPRDRLFDLIFLRLEALTPFKQSIQREYESKSTTLPLIIKSIFTETANDLITMTFDEHLPLWQRPLAQSAISALYLGTLRQWFHDETDGMVETMRFLDQWLERLEKLRQGDLNRTDFMNFLSDFSAKFKPTQT